MVMGTLPLGNKNKFYFTEEYYFYCNFYRFQAGNGIVVQESGYIKVGPPVASRSAADQSPEDNTIQVIAGSYSYPAPDGTNISLTYAFLFFCLNCLYNIV